MALQITTNLSHLGIPARKTIRHIGYDMYSVWTEGDTYCVQEIGEQLVARFPTEQEREAYFIEQEIAFLEWVGFVFPGQLDDNGELIDARNEREDNSPARIHPEM